MRATWLVLALLLTLALPATAGSRDDPEITDPPDDREMVGGAEDSENLIRSVDIVAGWIEDAGDEFILHGLMQQEIRGGSVEGNPTTQYEYIFHLSFGGSD